MAFSDDKDAILAILRQKHCADYDYVNAIAVDYPTLRDTLISFSRAFDCDTVYLDQLLSVVADADRVAQGVYYLKSVAVINNPVFVAKSVLSDRIEFNSGGTIQSADIVYDTTSPKILVKNNTIIHTLTIGSGSIIDLLEVEPGSCVQQVVVKTCESKVGRLLKILEGSCFEDVGIDEESEYGGILCQTFL